MKTILGFVAVCFTAAVIGCQTSNTVSPGALGNECGAKNGAACTKAKSECCGAKHCDGTSMGAVGEKADCASKCASECSKKTDANLGAVSDKAPCSAKSECSKAKSTCTKEADANLGAVSDKAPCSGTKRSCGAKKAGCGAN